MHMHTANSVPQEVTGTHIGEQVPTLIRDPPEVVKDEVFKAPESPAFDDVRALLSPSIVQETVADSSGVALIQQGPCDMLSVDQTHVSHDQSENCPVSEIRKEELPINLREPEGTQSLKRSLRSSSPSKEKIIPAPPGCISLSPAKVTKLVLRDSHGDQVQSPMLESEKVPGAASRLSHSPVLCPATPLARKEPLESAEIDRAAGSIRPASCLIDLETPQIGTILLRRESLRRKESPSKKTNPKKGLSPKKRQLKKRDTLQEREILQKFSEGSNADRPTQNEPLIQTSGPSIEVAPAAAEPELESIDCESESTDQSKPGAEEITLYGEETTMDSKDLQRAVEAIEVCEEAKKGITQNLPAENVLDENTLHQANLTIAKVEIDEAQQTVASVCEKADIPVRKTRSGTRFSDDTSMLKDFLNRAQARKAAKGSTHSPKVPKSPQESPKRSPRKRLGSRRINTSSPLRPEDLTPKSSITRSGTPPGKPQLILFEPGEGEEQTEGPASCRRSTRTRLPAPSKAPPGAPSFIPVRRGDGTDTVVLQRTEAQELAMTTRTNTRRNKGQSKPPLLALQDLPVEQEDIATTAKQSAASAKAVAWAEKLASYHESKDAVEDAEEQRPKVRRMRGLGAPNGTPAAKRTTAVVASSNGTPAAKRRGRLP